jgi:hypothetical protein
MAGIVKVKSDRIIGELNIEYQELLHSLQGTPYEASDINSLEKILINEQDLRLSIGKLRVILDEALLLIK